jgi:probable F420-dependent oxidoreductase
MLSAMRYSVTLTASDRSLPIAALARLVEDRAFDGLWLPDHTHVPVERSRTSQRENLARHERMLDPIVGLAMAAAVTTRVRLGTGVLLVPQRDPIATAKALASIDQQSGGRLSVGIGYGWNVDEMRDHGVDPATRRARSREHVLTMRRLWECEVASFAGDHVGLPPTKAWPKPIQRPLPVLVGAAAGPAAFAHIAEFGQGWVAVGGKGLAEAVPALRRALATAGRQVNQLQIVSFTSGDCDHAKIDHLLRGGATEVAFDVATEDPRQAVAALDCLATFIAQRSARDLSISPTGASTTEFP